MSFTRLHSDQGLASSLVRPPGQTWQPLGQILVSRGLLTPKDKLWALEAQANGQARFGEILIANKLVSQDALLGAVAAQYESVVADFKLIPPDIQLVDMLGVEHCLISGILPWRKRNDLTLIATARPDDFEDLRPELERIFGAIGMVIADNNQMHQAILNHHPSQLAADAETRVALEFSCRNWQNKTYPFKVAFLATALILLVTFFPKVFGFGLAIWAVATLLCLTLLKMSAAISQFHAKRQPVPICSPALSSRRPTVSILVPLFKEREIASRLVARLGKLSYPTELLDICLVVEEDDKVTRNALQLMSLPSHMRTVVVPYSKLKTKPRALNYALNFCQGEIIGIYDAEDAPAPDQIEKVAQRFSSAPEKVACLQGILDFYNTRTNWFSRCFAIEYASWFRVILPGLARLGFVVPLGGTTLFFRRSVLEKLGAWDAHNVTEDADLGVRLARAGYRTELIETVTHEEANCRFWPWVKQRSRWLKGYAVTWAVHSRHPVKLWKDLGAKQFLGFHLLFLGTLSQFLLAPILWSFWLIQFGLPHPIASHLPLWIGLSLFALFILSELINIAIGIFATRGPDHRFLMRWVPTLYYYFPMAALASYKGVFELLFRPFYWDKTTHGVFEH